MQAHAQTKDLLAVQELGRWKRLTMVKRYTQATDQGKRTAAEAVAKLRSLNPPADQRGAAVPQLRVSLRASQQSHRP